MKEHPLSVLLDQQSIQSLFNIFDRESKEICLVGGSIRDALNGKITRDIDIAANVVPDEIIEILKKNKLSYEDYAYKYGSINTYIGDQKFQITTLTDTLKTDLIDTLQTENEESKESKEI